MNEKGTKSVCLSELCFKMKDVEHLVNEALLPDRCQKQKNPESFGDTHLQDLRFYLQL